MSPAVPALKIVGKAMTPTQLRTIIDHGLGRAGEPDEAVHAGLGAGDLGTSGRRR